MVDVFQFVLNGVLLGGLYAGVALAFIVIFRGTRVINFAQGEVVMIGGFFIWTMVEFTPLPWWIAILAGMVLCGIVAIAIERLTIHPLIGQNIFSIVMVTIALVLVLRAATMLTWGTRTRIVPLLFGQQAGIVLGPFIFTASLFYGFIVLTLVVGALWWFFNYTVRGLTLSAIAEDQDVARAMGNKRKAEHGNRLVYSRCNICSDCFILDKWSVSRVPDG